MQNQSSPPEKKRIPTVVFLVPSVIVGLAIFLLIFNWVIPQMRYWSVESDEDVSEKSLPKVRASRVNLYIQSNVGGADVYVNGEKQESGTNSSDMKASFFGLGPGTYEIQLKKEGYQDAVQTVELGDGSVKRIVMELSEANAVEHK